MTQFLSQSDRGWSAFNGRPTLNPGTPASGTALPHALLDLGLALGLGLALALLSR